jgi:hypothetical protein
MPLPPRALVAAALAAAACLAGCGPERRSADPAGRGPEFFAAALASIERTPEPLRGELLRTCDKYGHRDRPCDEEGVRRDLLECWSDKGEYTFTWSEKRKLGPRALYLRTLRKVNLCMSGKGWRRLESGPELTSRRH